MFEMHAVFQGPELPIIQYKLPPPPEQGKLLITLPVNPFNVLIGNHFFFLLDPMIITLIIFVPSLHLGNTINHINNLLVFA